MIEYSLALWPKTFMWVTRRPWRKMIVKRKKGRKKEWKLVMMQFSVSVSAYWLSFNSNFILNILFSLTSSGLTSNFAWKFCYNARVPQESMTLTFISGKQICSDLGCVSTPWHHAKLSVLNRTVCFCNRMKVQHFSKVPYSLKLYFLDNRV